MDKLLENLLNQEEIKALVKELSLEITNITKNEE